MLLLLVRLGEEYEDEEEVDMIAARSSYLAWDSRGSWPKRLKANGAAVEVGNREKEDEGEGEDEDDIYERLFCYCGVGAGGCVGGKKCFLGEGHHHPYGAYICAVRLDGGGEIGCSRTTDYNALGSRFVLYRV